MANSDLVVQKFSHSLEGVAIDLVVSGSIAATESIKFIRSLRRLGARVYPWLTAGGSQFVTEMSLAWAANNPVQMSFSGESSHIGCKDICVVAPASVSFLAEIVGGGCSRPATALVQSYLGQKKPVLMLTNAHQSLLDSPFVQENQAKLAKVVSFLEPRYEENKAKFPDPKMLASEISHQINRLSKLDWPGVLVAMGTTRGYLDDIRYLSNYSSGSLGTHITEELYRNGFKTTVVCGPCGIRPTSMSRLIDITTNEELEEQCQSFLADDCTGVVFLPSVLDYRPKVRMKGKIDSQKEMLRFECQRMKKILPALPASSGFKVGFKLQTDVPGADMIDALAKAYLEPYALSHLVINQKADVDSRKHRAVMIGGKGIPFGMETIEGKQEIASCLTEQARLVFEKKYGS